MASPSAKQRLATTFPGFSCCIVRLDETLEGHKNPLLALHWLHCGVPYFTAVWILLEYKEEKIEKENGGVRSTVVGVRYSYFFNVGQRMDVPWRMNPNVAKANHIRTTSKVY